MDEPRDRLIDILLREELGGEQPPDLTDRIVARAFPRRRVMPFVRSVWSVAAMLLIVFLTGLVAGSLAWWKFGYPGISASGQFVIQGGKPLGRGATVVTSAGQSASLELGGYVKVDIRPNSQLRIDGDRYAEKVVVEAGEAHYSIVHDKGTFAVQTPFGAVDVVGTEFDVRVAAEDRRQTVLVRVANGTVALAGDWGQLRMTADEERTYFLGPDSKKPELRGGVQFGTVTAKSADAIEVRADGEERARRYIPRWVGGPGGGMDRTILAAIAKTPIGARVKVEWFTEEARPRLARLEPLAGGDKPR